MITSAATMRNIELIIETIIMSHMGISYYVEHNAQGTQQHHAGQENVGKISRTRGQFFAATLQIL